MSRDSELKSLCERLVAQQFDSVHDAQQALEQFELLTTPAMVLDLLNQATRKQTLTNQE